MMDERLYRETFSRLRASDEAKKEVLLKMDEMKKTRRPWRALRAAALAAMLTVALAVTANAASGGVLFENLRIVWQDGSHILLEDDSGARVEVVGVYAGTELRDGHLILTVDGTETDITDEIERDGTYSITVETDAGQAVDVSVTGTLEDCDVRTSVQDGGVDYKTAAENGITVTESFTTITGDQVDR